MKDTQLLMQAQACYYALGQFRRDRARNKRYTYGDQWSDVIDVDGQRMTEEQFISSQGSTPLKNNLIRRLVRNVIGVYSVQSRQIACTARDASDAPLCDILNKLLGYNADLNRLTALHSRSLEEFLISGLVVHRKWYGRRDRRCDCWTDIVPPNNFFVDPNMRDFRAWDCRCIGEIHDVSFGVLASQFAHDTGSLRRLQEIYDQAGDIGLLSQGLSDFGCADRFEQSFLMPRATGMCRVIEIWRKETLTGTINDEWVNREMWRYYYLAPTGDILAQGESPYAHGGHPYVMKAYPMIDGEIHSFVNDVIDQQRYTNRLITMYDWIMRSSAKGVLMVPEDCLPRGASPADFAEAWSRFNGVLVYRPSPQGNVPKQISCNSTNIGITDLLNLQLQFFEDISGVHSALQGKVASAGMSAEMYGQQTQNATATLLDLLDTFSEFVRDAAYLDVKNILQYYDEKRIRSIAGSYEDRLQNLSDTEFDISIASSLASPASRNASNQILLEIWKSGQITLDQMLQAGDFPFSSKLTT